MAVTVQSNFLPAQVDRLKRFSAEQAIDIHCHCLPGVDDGAADMPAALDLCRALVADGITTVIATPHQMGSYEGRNSASEIRLGVTGLRESLDNAGIPLTVLPGGDVRVDDQLLRRLASDDIMTLADGGKYLLLELPHEVLIDLTAVCHALQERSITPILSHPERQSAICRKPSVVSPWLQAGLLMQITAGSLLGDFGTEAHRTAWDFLAGGAVSIVASDSHDITRRPPSMTRAVDAITQKLGHTFARRVCIENTLKVIAGAEIARPREPVRAASNRRSG